MTITLDHCPKNMEYGPCGGVDFDGSCEVSPHRCTFLDVSTVRWHGVAAIDEPGHSDPVPEPVGSTGAARMRELIAARTIVVADFPARALDAASIAEVGGLLAGQVDAVLAGDAGAARVQFPPAYRASLIRATGLEVWTGVNCRDRNRVAIEGELAALAHVGVAGVHCVTGDHTKTGQRPDATPVFDLDSTEAAALASAAGHLVSVAEAPATPPVDRRPERLLEKQKAGAELCFINHCGGADAVGRFISRARDTGVTLGFLACIPIILDHESASLLRTFTTLVLPEGYVDGILAASDPLEAGIAAAIELGRDFLELDGIVGLDLSGGASPGREAWYSEALVRITQGLRA